MIAFDPGYGFIPTRTIEALDRYLRLGIRTGDFLYAVLTNNLKGAVAYGDDDNVTALAWIVRYVVNQFPLAAQGSEEKVSQWLTLSTAEREAIYPLTGHAKYIAWLIERRA